ncbi:homeobox protein cut-like 1 [Amphibalanus amphitrite]|uniref:homeobox protein cut-like 1 n=1 Tax=Amphibalanus amphitrite TaxID=1232801 RepID=UPI001C90429D|nr:homeobox protein cut-like 1 [Amphibalanus amphitrite]
MSAKVINIVQEWKKFGLSGLQSELDEVAAEIAARQDQSEDSRRALVELTRDFRKNTPEDVRKMIAPLLKSFQSEVDSLSNRSKGAESAFLKVYKKLIDMPDVTAALEYSQTAQHKLSKLADLQIENNQLRDTLKDYNEELKDVKSQGVTIKQLEEKIRQFETNQESIIEERTKEMERDLLREFQEREQTYHDEQLLSTRRLAEAEHRVAQLTSDLELSQSELFEVKAKYEENTHARSDELDMVLEDLERANHRAALAEREVDSLKEQLAATVKRAQLADEADGGSDSQRRSATERQLASKDNEICQLVEDVQRLQSQLSELENQSVCQRAKLEEELSQKSSIIQRLEAIIEQQKDYEELKKEFSILKSIEFPGTSQPSAGGADDRSQSEARPLQVLMLEKSKAMQNENTALKVKTSELQGEESWRGPSDAEEAASPDGKSSPAATEPLPSPRPSPSPAEHAATVAAAAAAAYRFDETDRADRLIPKGDPMETRLQEMLRYNMDKFSNQSLDTLQLARRVRELLSVNNIGQRMFARYILGLSQGTVSELLSKPKPWEKLTEKGRDSYRKMHAWAVDDAAVYLLKAVIPKKGELLLWCGVVGVYALHSVRRRTCA